MSGSLAGRRIIIPETREASIFAGMLRERGAEAVLCPLVAIKDLPDPGPAEACGLTRFVARPPDDLILLTGEGLRRLAALADRIKLRPNFVAALAQPRKIARGPKPVRALRELGLDAECAGRRPDERRRDRSASKRRPLRPARRRAILSRRGSSRAPWSSLARRPPRSMRSCPTSTPRRPTMGACSKSSRRWRPANSTRSPSPAPRRCGAFRRSRRTPAKGDAARQRSPPASWSPRSGLSSRPSSPRSA